MAYVKSARGGQLPSMNLPRNSKENLVTSSMKMMQEGCDVMLGAQRQPLTSFSPQRETVYIAKTFMPSNSMLNEIKDKCKVSTATTSLLETERLKDE